MLYQAQVSAKGTECDIGNTCVEEKKRERDDWKLQQNLQQNKEFDFDVPEKKEKRTACP